MQIPFNCMNRVILLMPVLQDEQLEHASAIQGFCLQLSWLYCPASRMALGLWNVTSKANLWVQWASLVSFFSSSKCEVERIAPLKKYLQPGWDQLVRPLHDKLYLQDSNFTYDLTCDSIRTQICDHSNEHCGCLTMGDCNTLQPERQPDANTIISAICSY